MPHMLRHTSLLLLFVVLMSSAVQAQHSAIAPPARLSWVQAADPAWPLDGQLVALRFQPGTTTSQIADLAAATGLYHPVTDKNRGGGGTWLLRLRQPAASGQYLAQLDWWLAQPQVAYASPILREAATGHRLGLSPGILLRVDGASALAGVQQWCAALGLAAPEATGWQSGSYRITFAKNIPLHTAAAAAQLAGLAGVRYAHPDWLLFPEVSVEYAPFTNDPNLMQQWGLYNDGSRPGSVAEADIKAQKAWYYFGAGSTSIKVAVLDSGVDTLHPELLDALLPGYDAFGEGKKGFPSNQFPSDGHGTACSGIIAAEADNNLGAAGVAFGCRLIPVQIFNYLDNGSSEPLPFGTASSFAGGIAWAWQTAGADVLSNSWSLPGALLQLFPEADIQTVRDLLTAAATDGRGGLGCPLLFSSGNDGNEPYFPAGVPGVMAVNGTTICDTRVDSTACGDVGYEGNKGGSLYFGAPGHSIYTIDMTGPSGFETGSYMESFGGTSAAAPHAAGVAALLLSARPDLNLASVMDIMATTADRVGGYNYGTQGALGSWSAELGYGRLNAYAALEKAGDYVVATNPARSQPVQLRMAASAGTATIWLAGAAHATQLEVWDTRGRLLLCLPPAAENEFRFALPGTGPLLLRCYHSGGQLSRTWMPQLGQ